MAGICAQRGMGHAVELGSGFQPACILPLLLSVLSIPMDNTLTEVKMRTCSRNLTKEGVT